MLRLVIFIKLVLRLRILRLERLRNGERLRFFSFLKTYFLIRKILRFFNEENVFDRFIDV